MMRMSRKFQKCEARSLALQAGWIRSGECGCHLGELESDSLVERGGAALAGGEVSSRIRTSIRKPWKVVDDR